LGKGGGDRCTACQLLLRSYSLEQGLLSSRSGQATGCAGRLGSGENFRHILIEAVRSGLLSFALVIPRGRHHRVNNDSHGQSSHGLGVDAHPELPKLPFHATPVFVPWRFAIAFVPEAFGLLIRKHPTAIAPKNGATEHLRVQFHLWYRCVVVGVSFDAFPLIQRASAARSADEELLLRGDFPASGAPPAAANAKELQYLNRVVAFEVQLTLVPLTLLTLCSASLGRRSLRFSLLLEGRRSPLAGF